MYWTDDIIDMVWKKGAVVEGFNPALWRKDECGAWIARLRYGDRGSDYGWEIRRIAPNGPDAMPNLRPLQAQNAVDKAGALVCGMTADGARNIRVEQEVRV
jgi:hypothetical protein